MAYSDLRPFGLGAGFGNLAAGISGLFNNGNNPADAANKYIGQIPGATSKYFEPYVHYGQEALPILQGQYNDLLGSPGGKLNEIGQSFHESPGFKFALQQALQGANHAAAAGGMAGSPQHEQQNMQIGTNLANQDYYNWLNQATGLYGKGLSGEQGLMGGGLQAGNNLADMIAQTLAQQAQYEYEGQAAKNESKNSLFSNIGSGLGLLGAFF